MTRSTLANGEAAPEPDDDGLVDEPFIEPELEAEGVVPASEAALIPDSIAATEVAATAAESPDIVAPMMPSVTGGVSAAIDVELSVEVELSPPVSA